MSHWPDSFCTWYEPVQFLQPEESVVRKLTSGTVADVADVEMGLPTVALAVIGAVC